MDLQRLLLWNAAAIACSMLLMWVLSLAKSDVSIVDIFWGLGFVLVAWLSVLLVDEASTRGWLIAILTTLWGLRLAGYLAWRNHGEPEDRRYREMREKYGQWFPLVSLGVVFGLQGAIMWVVSLPLQVSPQSSVPLGWLDGVGAVFWAIGLFFEAVGDYQMGRFQSRKQHEGEVLDTGLWRYTRHPNYFGDFLVWWGMFLIALAGGYWWTGVSPLLMSFLLMRVSGVTLLEKSLKDRKPAYREYVRRTSAFFPMPPKGE